MLKTLKGGTPGAQLSKSFFFLFVLLFVIVCVAQGASFAVPGADQGTPRNNANQADPCESFWRLFKDADLGDWKPILNTSVPMWSKRLSGHHRRKEQGLSDHVGWGRVRAS